MKRIISTLVLGILFSCSNETETSQASADAAIIRLLKTPDKNSLSTTERKDILKHLEKNPEDFKYLLTEGISRDFRARNPNSRITDKTADYSPADYMQVQVHQPNTADFGASLEITSFGGYKHLIYGWTIAHNLVGIFDIKSYEDIKAYDNGPFGTYNYSYKISSANHIGSGLTGTYGPLGWNETSRNVTYTDTYVWFFTGGQLIQGNSSINIASNRAGNINSIVYSNGVYTSAY